MFAHHHPAQADEAAHGHDHGHDHDHAHDHAPPNFDRAFAIGIAANLAFVIIEAFFGWRVNSLALLADAGHNLSDVAALGVAWAAALVATVRPDARYTYGWKRASIVAAFANAVLLLIAMGSLAWEALGRLASAQPTDGRTVMAVAAVGIVVNLGTALLFMRGRDHDLNIRGAYLHMAGDALVSAGVVVSGALVMWWGWSWLDPATSLVIALVIVAATWGLFRQSLRLLFDGVPEGIELVAVRRELESLPGVDRVHDLHVWATGTTETALTAHLVLPRGHPSDRFFEDAAARLKARFGIGHVTLQAVTQPSMTPCGGPVEAVAGGAASSSRAGGPPSA